MVAFLTFGLITPTHEIWEAFDQNPSNRASIGPSSGTSTALALNMKIAVTATTDTRGSD